MDHWATQETTRWWWIRHAPVPQLKDRIYGNTDPEADVSDTAAYTGLASKLPKSAVWVVSHLQRTRQTAEAVGRGGYSLPDLIVEPDIGEQDFGALHGVRHVDHAGTRSDAFRGFWPCDPLTKAPEGESLACVRERVSRAVERISDTYAGRDIVCVAHGGPIVTAIASALAIDLRRAVSIDIRNLSITRIHRVERPQAGGPEWRVLGIGEPPR
jgi:alpha-ribazole phosphatase